MSEMTVESTTFRGGELIPLRAADSSVGGEGVSPQLSWSGAPEGTRSFAVTCYDPDAPTTVGFAHWVMFDIPPTVTSLEEGAGAPGKTPAGAVLGFTDYGTSQYGGMSPPQGDPPHRYVFTVYALPVDSLGADETTTYAKFHFMTRDKVLAKGELTGRYEVPASG